MNIELKYKDQVIGNIKTLNQTMESMTTIEVFKINNVKSFLIKLNGLT
jgi:hypothetical protein